jgi:hypothetical protein
MSFWDLSDGGTAADTGTDFEIPSGNLDPIPDGSSVLAMIDEAKWDERDGAEYISLRWTVLAPDEYKNRKIFQKLWVTDDDPSANDSDKAAKKRDKARRMLAAIDANAGGKLTRKPGKPSDDDLTSCLTNKPMIVKAMVWEMPDRERMGEFIRGNWISAVAPKSKGIDVKEAKAAPKPARGGAPAGGILDDDVPFAPW